MTFCFMYLLCNITNYVGWSAKNTLILCEKKKKKKLLFKACAGNILKFQSTRGFEINTYLSEVN